MKLLWCLSALAIVNAAIDVERTILQVQSILKQNSQLPRLTRTEIIELLNDIKAEDERNSASKERSKEQNLKTTDLVDKNQDVTTESTQEHVRLGENELLNEIADSRSVTTQEPPESTTKLSDPNVLVVLPYTPRDGSSLQELYTRPPRVQVVPASQIIPESTKMPAQEKNAGKNSQETKFLFETNAQLAQKAKKPVLLPELEDFLNSHGLKGEPGKDHFLLPLDGFKPLPPAKVIDGSIQLPENILLSYDLISPVSDESQVNKNNELFDLRPDSPIELHGSPSEGVETILPLDLPKIRKIKSASNSPPTNEPFEYDAFKVIPLQKQLEKGPEPELDSAKLLFDNEQNKRQTDNSTTDVAITDIRTSDDVASSESPKETNSETDPVSDTGASIADLEDSFGGAMPSEPGDSELPPQRKNGFYWMLDWNSFLEVGDGDNKVNIRLEPKLGDPQMFLPVTVP